MSKSDFDQAHEDLMTQKAKEKACDQHMPFCISVFFSAT